MAFKPLVQKLLNFKGFIKNKKNKKINLALFWLWQWHRAYSTLILVGFNNFAYSFYFIF